MAKRKLKPKVVTDSTINAFMKKFSMKVKAPWDGKLALGTIGPSEVAIGVRATGIPDEVGIFVRYKNLEDIMNRDIFDIPTLTDAGLIDILTPKISVPKGKYRNLRSGTPVIYPTGIISVDTALGWGGFFGGLAHRLWGPSQSGKSVLLYMLMITAYNLFRKGSLLINQERSFDEDMFDMLGGGPLIDSGMLKVFDSSMGEEAYEEAVDGVRSNQFAIAGIDSITGLMSESEIQKHLSKNPRLGDKARLQTRFIEKVLPFLHETTTALAMIAQTRVKTDDSRAYRDSVSGSYAGAEGMKPAAADAIEFYSSQSCRFNAPKEIKWNSGRTAMDSHTASGLIDKNRRSRVGRTFSFFIDYDNGVEVEHDLIEHAVKLKIIALDGKAHVLPSGDRFPTNSATITALREDKGLYWNLYREVIKEVQGKHGVALSGK